MSGGFSYYWAGLQRRLPVILLISFVAAVFAFAIVRNIEPVHEAHFSYLVSLSDREVVQEFRFDGFYGLQATDLFAATLAKWVQTPEVIVAAYEEAGLLLTTENPRELTRQVRSEKTAPQLVEITVTGERRDEVVRLAEGLRAVMKENVQTYHDQGVPAASFSVVATDQWVGMSRVSAPLISIVVFVFVLFIAINVALLLESLKHD